MRRQKAIGRFSILLFGMPKLHSNLLYGLHEMLVLVFREHQAPKKVFRFVTTKHSRWGKRDRDFLADHFYGIIRYLRKYTYLTDQEGVPLSQVDYWKVIGCHFALLGYELPSFCAQHIDAVKLASLPFPIEHAYPDWFYEKMVAQYGKERGEREMVVLNQAPKPVLRVNTLKASLEIVCEELERLQLPYRLIPEYPDAILLEKHVRVDRLPIYHKGWVEIQDAGSQAIGLFCPVKPGDVVIDACAGAGGKTLYFAARMKNQGNLFACDIHSHRLSELEKRAARAGVSILQTVLVRPNGYPSDLPLADVVFVDAPCTGSGTLKRHPELKWRWTPSDLVHLTKNQVELLNLYATRVKVGGFLVYATCSLFHEENQSVVDTFLQSQQRDAFWKEEEKRILPSFGFDGFYMCRLRRMK